MFIPPKPKPRADKVSLWQYFRAFRRDILSAQPQRLYKAWMAEFKTPFFRSYLINQPELINIVLKQRPDDFPKSQRIAAGLEPLLGDSVFLTNGPHWKAQRRIIDPAFEGGRVKDSFAPMYDAAQMMVQGITAGCHEVEEIASRAAADVIFRTLFSIPITDNQATQVFNAFRRYQRTQPILNLAAFFPLPKWFPKGHKKETIKAAKEIRTLITDMTRQRATQIKQGTAPDDLATRIMTTPDNETGKCFDWREMVDQVAIFFLAGHETSASALAWALYLVASDQDVLEKLNHELNEIGPIQTLHDLGKATYLKDVFRETLRLYPPVPMMVRQSQKCEHFRDREIEKGAHFVISPWHVHRHERIWQNPDAFDPDRWSIAQTREAARTAYLPFSSGQRVCPGAGFAMIEGPLLLATILQNFTLNVRGLERPKPLAYLTVRAKDGIKVHFEAKQSKVH